MDLSKVTKRVITHRIKLINEFREHIRTQYQSEHLRIDNLIFDLNIDDFKNSDDFDDYADFLSDQQYTLDEIKKLSDQLSIIALYRIVELGTKKQLLHLYSKSVAKNLYVWPKLKLRLLEDHNINLESLDNYNDVNELREINNAIKHENKVTRKLSEFQGWNKGDDLENLDAVFNRLSLLIPIYLSNLVRELIKAKETLPAHRI